MEPVTIKLTRGQLSVGLAVLFLAFAHTRSGSETLTLTTYYPAPYGAYKKIVTTDQTVLARDTGNVIIGQTSNGANGRLAIGTASALANLDVHDNTPYDATNGNIVQAMISGSGNQWTNCGLLLANNSKKRAWGLFHQRAHADYGNIEGSLQFVKYTDDTYSNYITPMAIFPTASGGVVAMGTLQPDITNYPDMQLDVENGYIKAGGGLILPVRAASYTSTINGDIWVVQ